MFVSTTVKNYLFDGVRFCVNPQGLAKAICNQIKESGSKTLRELKDGSLAFSFFHHVSSTKLNKCMAFCLSLHFYFELIYNFTLSNRKMVPAKNYLKFIPAKVML